MQIKLAEIIKKIPVYLIGIIIAWCIFWMLTLLGIFLKTNSIAKSHLTTTLTGQFSLGVNSESYDQIIRYFGQIENLGLISCADLAMTNREEAPRQLIHSDANCNTRLWEIFSSKEKIIVNTPNERKWQMSFIYKSDTFMLVYFYSMLFLGWISIVTLNVFRQKLIKEKETSLLKEFEIKNYFFVEARKYAHDIRSPLSAFNAIAFSLKASHPEQVSLMNLALQKISALTDSFLEVVKKNSGEFSLGNHTTTYQNLIKLLSEEIDLKKFEYKSITQSKVQIFLESSTSNKNYQYRIPSEIGIRRIVSNLINNAIESIPDSGSVVIHLKDNEEAVAINICDNGPGIPNDILKKLGKKIISTKPNGNGIGIYDAALVLKKVGGKLSITSSNSGTTCSLMLSKVKAN